MPEPSRLRMASFVAATRLEVNLVISCSGGKADRPRLRVGDGTSRARRCAAGVVSPKVVAPGRRERAAGPATLPAWWVWIQALVKRFTSTAAGGRLVIIQTWRRGGSGAKAPLQAQRLP